MTRFGERTANGAASFRFAKCGELAGIVRVARAGTTVDMGPPLGRQAEDRDGLVVDYFLGTAWLAAGRAALDAVQAVIDAGTIDPVALCEVNPDLVPFYCPDCRLNYCSRDWDTYVLIDEGIYEGTMGRCPHGHEHMVDD